MRKPCLVVSVALASLALLVPAAPSAADENVFGRCPDGYTPTVFLIAFEEDRNGNGVVCAKATPGNEEIVTDDPNGQPYRCNGILRPEDCPIVLTDDIL